MTTMMDTFKKYGHFADGGHTAAEKRGMTSSMHMSEGGKTEKKMAEGQKIAPVTAYKKGGKSCKKMAAGDEVKAYTPPMEAGFENQPLVQPMPMQPQYQYQHSVVPPTQQPQSNYDSRVSAPVVEEEEDDNDALLMQAHQTTKQAAPQYGMQQQGQPQFPQGQTQPYAYGPQAAPVAPSYGPPVAPVRPGVRFKITQFPGEIRSLYWAAGTVVAPGTQIEAEIIHDVNMEYEIQVNSVIGLQQSQVGSYCNIGNINFIDGSANGVNGISLGQSTAVLDLTTISATPTNGTGLFDVEIVGLSQRVGNVFGTNAIPQPYNYAIVKFNSFRQ
ncbi:unnamed protein product [Sphagnum jensenii]